MTDLPHPALTLLLHTRWDDAFAWLIDRSRSMIGADGAEGFGACSARAAT